MQAWGFWKLGNVSNEELLRKLKALLVASARTEARVVAHLAELDARRLTLLGGVSLYEYCVKQLRLSEHQAYFRITAARAARKFPLIFELLERRELHLTAVALLSKYLTHDNHVELLEEAKGKSKRQLLKLLAGRWPKADFTSQVRRLPLEVMAAGPTGSLEYLSEYTHRLELLLSTQQHDKLELARDLMLHANPTGNLGVVLERALDLLIDHERKRQFAVLVRGAAQPSSSSGVRKGRASGETRGTSAVRKTDEVRAAATLGERSATGRTQEIEEAALVSGPPQVDKSKEVSSVDDRGTRDQVHVTDALGTSNEVSATDERETLDGHDVAKAREKYPIQAALDSVRTELSTGPGLRSGRRAHVPNVVRRAVLERDGFRCTYTSPEGERCECRRFLQIHHERAWAKGGPETLENLRLLCAPHNQLLAELEFGQPPRTGS